MGVRGVGEEGMRRNLGEEDEVGRGDSDDGADAAAAAADDDDDDDEGIAFQPAALCNLNFRKAPTSLLVMI